MGNGPRSHIKAQFLYKRGEGQIIWMILWNLFDVNISFSRFLKNSFFSVEFDIHFL